MRLSGLSPTTADPADLAIDLTLPSRVDVGPGSAVMLFSTTRTDTNETDQGEFVLQRNGTIFSLASADYAAVRALQAAARQWQSENSDATKGTLMISLSPCRRGAGPVADATVSVAIRMERDGVFCPLCGMGHCLPLRQRSNCATCQIVVKRIVEIWARHCYLGTMPCAGAMTARFKEDNALSLSTTADTAAKTGAKSMNAPQTVTSDALLTAVLKSLEDDKGEDIVQVNLRGKSEIGDFMVIASGRSTRQVTAMAEKLADRLKQDFGVLCKTEGKDTGDWVLIDSGDIIVHIFRPEVREFYQLEKMWQPGAATAP